MFNKHLSHQRSKEPHQLEITPFLNLMVALVPFLLVTAVFSRVAILELNLPSTQQVEAADEQKQTIENAKSSTSTWYRSWTRSGGSSPTWMRARKQRVPCCSLTYP